MEVKVNALFRLRNDAAKKEGKSPIYLRITIAGKRMEWATQQYVEGAKWSREAEKVKGTSEEAKILNQYLLVLKNKVLSYQQELMLTGMPVTIENFRNKWLGIIEKDKTILAVFQEHNDKMRQLVGAEFAEGTMERYQTSFEHTRRFLKDKYGIEDMELKHLDYKFITEYEFWLKTVRKCAHNTAMKYLSNFRKIVFICVKNGWLNKDPFYGYKMMKKEVKRDFLTEVELEVMRKKEFSVIRLERVRDIFLFACFTGLAYADVKKLTKSEIREGLDGRKWIFTHRKKTDTLSRIPLLSTSLEILKKYADHPECLNSNRLLPILTNQKMNSYLKELADLCGIEKDLTFHIARHTFATTVTLNNGVPIETVAHMLGHNSLKTTQHYAKLLDSKISGDMIQLEKVLDFKGG